MWGVARVVFGRDQGGESLSDIALIRWRMWQNQLSAIGKVYPIILPESLTDTSLGVPFSELSKEILMCSLQRVQEVDYSGGVMGLVVVVVYC